MARMALREIAFSLCDSSQEFIREYKNSSLTQDEIDAIIVDFLNFVSFDVCRMDLAMYTMDLRGKEKMYRKRVSEENRQMISSRLRTALKSYASQFTICELVNKYKHRNNCGGTATFENDAAIAVIESFIQYYLEH